MRRKLNGALLLLIALLQGCGGGDPVKPLRLVPVSIQTQPASLTVVEPVPATLSVVASGTLPLTYQWRKNGLDLPGATQAALTFNPTRQSDTGSYTVKVDNPLSQPVISSAAVLAVSPPPTGPPQILEQPQSLTVSAPATATLRVVATGTQPLSYQWKKNGTNISNATASTLTLAATSPADSGSYSVLVSNGLPPDALSQAATLTVNAGVTGTFSLTAGPLALGRARHSATLLEDGRVLLAGGNTPGGTTNTAELYDPATNRFTPLAGTLQAARSDHTATLLANGKVIIAGGSGLFGPVNSAEVFDPASGLFTRTPGDLLTARAQHTATLLGNGRVLLAGGQGAFGPLTSAELYDPATGTFLVTTASLGQGRSLHTATLMADGQVLLLGGQGSSGTIAAAERFNPITGGFSNYGGLQIPRANHVAVPLGDGRVLLAGGVGATGPLASAELELNGLFQRTQNDLSSPRNQAAAAVLGDGRVLVAGGSHSTGSLASAELFDPALNRFSLTGALNTARSQPTATVLKDGRILVVGGTALGAFLATAERFQ